MTAVVVENDSVRASVRRLRRSDGGTILCDKFVEVSRPLSTVSELS